VHLEDLCITERKQRSKEGERFSGGGSFSISQFVRHFLLGL
jgi:hypothetical protein